MSLSVCPVAVVAAPVELVWRNLVQWECYSEWADVQVERSEPEGPAAVGQTIYFKGVVLGRTLRFIFNVEDVNTERYQLGLHAFFPLGLQRNHTLPALPSTRLPAPSNMAETSSSPQVGGVGFLKNLALKRSLPA